MEITIDHIQGFITGAFIPIILFIIKHFFIDKGNLNIKVKEYNIYGKERSGLGHENRPISELDNSNASILLKIKILLSNKGKRKLSIHTIKVTNPKLNKQLVLSNNIIELSDGDSKISDFNYEISFKVANLLIENNSKLIIIDNTGKIHKIKIKEVST